MFRIAIPFMVINVIAPAAKPTTTVESCNSKIYCQGPLLDFIQRSRVYPDSKTFVDLSLINSEETTLRNFDQFISETSQPSKEEILNFIHNNFVETSELESWMPTDFTANPPLLQRIKRNDLKSFAGDIINIWPSLGRKIGSDVFQNPAKHSLIAVPNGIIIPGGRFNEFYYWDSYWIIEGLLLSEMTQTARGMIENLMYMVKQYGFVPNGGRVYYLNRSQPPMLTHMANLYFEKTHNLSWIAENIDTLDKELRYWVQRKTVQVTKDTKEYTMAHYISESNTPRPESYYEDVSTCAYFADDGAKRHCYQGLKSGAESGWDFSSRWLFDQEGGVNTNLTHIDAQRVVPVDLNAFLCSAFLKLSRFYKHLGDQAKSTYWLKHSQQWFQAIQDVLYDKQDGIWYDYDMELARPRKMFYPSNFAPLWTGTYDLTQKQKYGLRAAEYFTKLNIGQYKGGIPTSLDDNNEQWDFPNAWPPLQEFVILGLWNTGNRRARKIAEQSAERWIKANLIGFQQQDAMFEKYDASSIGQYGGGGEYEVQKGFGWTNGVALKLIDQFYTSSEKRRVRRS